MAATSAQLMAGSYAADGLSSIAGAYSQSMALQAQGDYQKSMAETNARLADIAAKDAIDRGDKEAASHMNKTRQMIGTQRSGYAAQGVQVDNGSAQQVQDETLASGMEDAVRIRANAWRAAWGFKVEANNARGQGAMAAMGARNAARNTLLTGGMQALSSGMKAGAYMPASAGSTGGGTINTAGGSYNPVSNIA